MTSPRESSSHATTAYLTSQMLPTISVTRTSQTKYASASTRCLRWRSNNRIIDTMKIENIYVSPEVYVVDICTEGVMCGSVTEDNEFVDGEW